MKKVWLSLAGVLGVIVLTIGWGVSVSNHLVDLDEGVKQRWAQVENVYQRRMDLIPNLVSTVKGYAKHEAEVFEKVTLARAQAGQIKVSQVGDLAKFQKAQGELTQALSRLMVVSEKYPELKADRNFLELQSQLEGTENRITVERMKFNESAQSYNSYLRHFPQSMIAGFRGFAARSYFEAVAGAQVAPKVEF
jgi:LemA protein